MSEQSNYDATMQLRELYKMTMERGNYLNMPQTLQKHSFFSCFIHSEPKFIHIGPKFLHNKPKFIGSEQNVLYIEISFKFLTYPYYFFKQNLTHPLHVFILQLFLFIPKFVRPFYQIKK